MKKVLHKIYWNLSNLTGDAAGKIYAFVYAKPPYLVMKSCSQAFLEMPKLILIFIQTIDIGLKQRLMKKLKQNAYYMYYKVNILFYAFLNHFGIVITATCALLV